MEKNGKKNYFSVYKSSVPEWKKSGLSTSVIRHTSEDRTLKNMTHSYGRM